MSVLPDTSFPCGRAFAQGGCFGPYWAGSACSGKACPCEGEGGYRFSDGNMRQRKRGRAYPVPFEQDKLSRTAATATATTTAIMKQISRRSFLAASAAVTAAAPALAAPGAPNTPGAPASKKSAPPPSRPGTVDVVIVGAGAAGIAAARRLSGSGLRVALVEAGAVVGGRCVTDTSTFGVPFDRGAHWLHMPDINPVAKLGAQTGLDLY